MENELLVLNTEEVNESENLNYDELEELLEQQFTMEFSNLEKLELECKEISSPDKLGDVILDEIWNQFANQIGLDVTRSLNSIMTCILMVIQKKRVLQ